MLLHAGAGLHGHEYTTQQLTKQTTKQPSQQAVTTLKHQMDHGSNTKSQTANRPVSQLLPSMSYISSFLPSPKAFWDRPSSEYFFKNYLSDPSREVEGTQSDPSSLRTSIDGDGLPLYIEPETESNYDRTCNSSEYSKTKRPKTRFHFARPVPGSHGRLKRSDPRLLLQLRREHRGRPLPSIEVVPAKDVARSKLNSEDIIIMRSDHDKSASWYGKERDAVDGPKDRDILAVMTPCGNPGEGNAEIVMENGSIWRASKRPNGGYDFCRTDDQGVPTIVRWVKRSPASPSSTSQQFSFCTMDPLVRSHPFLGSLRPNQLDVFETFTTSIANRQAVRPASYAGDGSILNTPSKQTANVSDDQKRLMTVTAIWISFCEEDWPGKLPVHTKPCKPKGAALSHRPSDDHSSTPRPSLATLPITESASWASVTDPRSPCSFQGKRSASTGAAFMERRRAAARAASPSSTGSVRAKSEGTESHPHRSKLRTWAHRLMHPGSRKTLRSNSVRTVKG